MKARLILFVQILLGTFCLFFGLNKFFHFMTFPPIAGDGGTLMKIYISSGFMYLIAALEISGGIMLILDKFKGIAVVVLTAILFNALLFHLLFDRQNFMGALVGLAMAVLLILMDKGKFNVFFK